MSQREKLRYEDAVADGVRSIIAPDYRYNDYGFRVALDAQAYPLIRSPPVEGPLTT